MQLNQNTERRLGRIIDTAYYLLMLAAFYLFMRYAFWLAFPFMFSFFIAAALQRPVNFFQRRFKIKKGFSAVMLVLFFYLVIVVILVVIGMRIWVSARDFGGVVTQQLENLPEIIVGLAQRISELAQRLPEAMAENVDVWLTDNVIQPLAYGGGIYGENGYNGYSENGTGEGGVLMSLVSHINFEWFRAPMSGVLTAAGRIPTIVFAALITVVSTFFMTTSYDSISNFIKRQLSPQRQSGLSATKRIMFSSLGKLLRANLILMVITGVLLALGLLILQLLGLYGGSYLIAIALITAAMDILPGLGTATVLIPWGLYSIIMGNIGLGVGLLVILAVITVVRQVVDPKVMASNLGLPPIATIGAMYIGLQLFGFIGLLLMPILLTIVKVLNDEGVIKLWKTSGSQS